MTTLAARGQNVLFLQEKANVSNGTLKVPVLVESDTPIGICPTVTVKAFDDSGNLLDKQVTNTNMGFSASLDFVNCTGSVELSVPTGKDRMLFQALDADGEVLAEGALISTETLKDPPVEGSALEKLDAGISSIVALIGAYVVFVFVNSLD